MLKPFQIRNLRVSQPADSRTSAGVVQISATDYDDLASNHPRARLTYMDDDDDDETITVGSAFELSQRLDEPLDINTQLECVEISPENVPMHIFDIRRSNSVTELWKRFEDNVPKQGMADEKDETQATPKTIVLEEQHEVPAPHSTTSPSVSGDQPRSLMEAFEDELAGILNAAKSSDTRVPQPDSPPIGVSSTNTDSGRSPHPVEILAAQVLDQLINGATMVQSEWKSKIPELQRQLHNAQKQFEAAQRSLPQNVQASLRTLLATVEAHLRTAFNNLPDAGRQMAEDAFQAGRPVAENAADGFRMMASELNEVGRTLFAAFESEFGRASPTASASTPASEMPNSRAPGPFSNPSSSNESAAPSTLYSQSSIAHPSSTARNEKSTVDSGQPHPSNNAQTGVPPIHGQSASAHSEHWAPLSWPAPLWNPFQTYNAPSPACPPLPPTSLPNFTYWPQGPPAPPPLPPTFNAPFNATQTSQVKSGETENNSATKSLFIGNVGFKVTDRMVQDVFAAKGFLVKVDLPLDTASGRHAGFGYVHFPSDYPAFAAMEALQGAVIDGHSINLEPMYRSSIEGVRPTQISPNASTATHDTQTDSALAEASDITDAPSERNNTISGPPISPFAIKLQNSPSEPSKTDNRKKSVGVDLTENFHPRQDQTEPSALLDSPSDDPAFSARFPSLLPETSAQHNDPSESRFPPMSQWEAQLLTNRQGRITGVLHSQSSNDIKHPEVLSTHSSPLHPTPKAFSGSRPASHLAADGNQASIVDAGRPSDHSKSMQDQIGHSPGDKETVRPVLDVNDPQYAVKLKRRVTEHQTSEPNQWHAAETGRHNPLGHSASMRRPADTWARLSRRERNDASSHEQIPGSFPVEDTTRVEVSSTHDTSVPESDNGTIEQCVSALVDMGYGAGQEGGRSRMAVYAAMANGVLTDAIDMIEEERQIYERRPSQ